jgi:dihydropyrimidine dehydrogenase (NAD+) subunit PreT
VQPVGLQGKVGIEGVRLVKLEATADGSLVPKAGSEKVLAAEMVVLAIGQGTHTAFLGEAGREAAKIELERGRIVIDRVTGQTSNPKFFAGGDCTNGGREVVDAVADGKRAGMGIAAWLEGRHGGA